MIFYLPFFIACDQYIQQHSIIPQRCTIIRAILIILIISFCGCTSWQKIKTGTQAFEYKKYALAIDMLEEEILEKPDPQKYWLLARSYDNLGYYEESLRMYKRTLNTIDDLQLLLEYARVLKKAEQYKEASDVFNILKTEATLDPVLDKELASCARSMEWKANPDSLVQVRPSNFNSQYAEYAPTWIDGQLIFTSDRPKDTRSDIYDWTGRTFSDFWRSDKSGLEVYPWLDALNTPQNEGNAVLHPNGQELYFTRCSDEGRSDVFCHLLVSKRDDYGNWSSGEPIDALNGPFNTKHPSFSADGGLLFYSSDQPGGLGGYDLFFSRLGPDGWGTGSRLSQMVNTEKDEVFPTLDGDTLYFSSNGHPGMGGLDLFKTYFGQDDQWVRPINLRAPFNSGADDFAMWFDTLIQTDEVMKKGLLSSNRLGGKGADDIYAFEVKRKSQDTLERDQPWLLTVKVLEPIYNNPGDPNSGIRKYKPLNGASIVGGDIEYQTDITGMFTRTVAEDFSSQLRISREGYFDRIEMANMSDSEERLLFLKVVLQPILYDREINLANIYYDFEKWDIREDARPSLDSLSNILITNPNINIRLASHTDCRGDDDFNLNLSQKRAESAVAYLIEKGIEPSRLEAEGKGEKKPYVSCICADCTEEEHQANRRTTFQILKEQ